MSKSNRVGTIDLSKYTFEQLWKAFYELSEGPDTSDLLEELYWTIDRECNRRFEVEKERS